MWLRLLPVLLLAAACVEPDDPIFRCEHSDECDVVYAYCEADHYCSWLDPTCESGRRYGGLAPRTFANQCVPVNAPDPLP